MVRARQTPGCPQPPQRTLEVAEPIRDQPECLTHRRHPTGPTRGHLSVGQRRLGLLLDQPRNHHEVLGHSRGILLRQGPQLGTRRTIQLRTRDILVDSGIRQPRASPRTVPPRARR